MWKHIFRDYSFGYHLYWIVAFYQFWNGRRKKYWREDFDWIFTDDYLKSAEEFFNFSDGQQIFFCSVWPDFFLSLWVIYIQFYDYIKFHSSQLLKCFKIKFQKQKMTKSLKFFKFWIFATNVSKLEIRLENEFNSNDEFLKA